MLFSVHAIDNLHFHKRKHPILDIFRPCAKKSTIDRQVAPIVFLYEKQVSFVYCTLMETFLNRFVFCLLLHLFAMEKVAPVPLFRPSCGRIFHKNSKVWANFKISVVLECLQQLQQNFSEVQPFYEFCNVILSKNFYFKKTKMVVFCRKISQYLVT